MPSKRRKYNARFPAGRIKKIMQTDEQVGKVAQAVPIIISRTLELFVQSLLKSALAVTNAKNARTLSPSHMKQCIVSDSRFHFLKELVRSLPDVNTFDEDAIPSASSAISAPEEALSSFSGRRFRNLNQQTKPRGVPEEGTAEDKESEDSDTSTSDKDAALTVEESTSDFVIDEDYGS